MAVMTPEHTSYHCWIILWYPGEIVPNCVCGMGLHDKGWMISYDNEDDDDHEIKSMFQ